MAINKQEITQVDVREKILERYVEKSFLFFNWQVVLSSTTIGKKLLINTVEEYEGIYLNGKLLTLQECLEHCQKQNGLDYCKNCGLTATIIHQALAEERERVVKVEEKYQELIMAVEKKYEGETRHETVLKYIRRAESNDYGEAGNSSLDKPDKDTAPVKRR